MADISNLKGWWSGGALYIGDYAGNAIITINPSTGGVSLTNAGGLTVSSGVTVTGGGMSISSGRIAFGGEKTRTATVDLTLTASSCGCTVLASVSDIIITLPGTNSLGPMIMYNIVSTLTTAGQIVIKTTTTQTIVGGAVADSTGVSMLANTAATHVCGDYAILVSNPATTSWSIMGLAGTWASTT